MAKIIDGKAISAEIKEDGFVRMHPGNRQLTVDK